MAKKSLSGKKTEKTLAIIKIQASKFISGVMSALSTMVNLEIPHVNIISKVDLLNKQARKHLEKFIEPDMHNILLEEMNDDRFGQRFQKLNQAIGNLIDDYSLVRFLPMDVKEEESIHNVLMQIDNSIQYGEDLEPKEHPEFDQENDEDDLDPNIFQSEG